MKEFIMANPEPLTNDIFDEDCDLVDIKSIKINQSKPVQEKIIDFVRQIKNPYFFKVGDVAVKVNFNNDGASFEEKFQNYLKECVKN